MEDDKLYHYGTPRHSGRYPWGSGENPYQHDDISFLGTDRYYTDKGLSDTEKAHAMGYSTTEYRRIRSNAIQAQKAARNSEWARLREKGMSYAAIGERYGVPATTVMSALKNSQAGERVNKVDATSEMLKERIDSGKYIDISPGSEQYLGVSDQTLKKAVQKLIDDGYSVQPVQIPRANDPNAKLNFNVIAPPGTSYIDIKNDLDNIVLPVEYVTNDGGKSWLGIEKPESLDPSRVMVRYPEDGGADMDGIIEIRRGVDDLSLGQANYAQVRIAVDNSHYMKGMAVYSDAKDWPEGIDIVYNTHYPSGTPMLGSKDNTVMKPMKMDKETGDIDWANPFGALIKIEDGQIVGQRHYIDENGEDHLSPINIVKEQGDWEKWSKSLSSQFLSKQYDTTIKKQLDLSYDIKKEEFDDIMSLENPEIKRKLLGEFADECDSSAVHLKAAALPRQSTKVILPVPSLKDNEIFAPTYEDGEQVALVRYPHAGIFEIPILTVNNRSKMGKDIIGNNAIDAVGINPKAAAQLSGADFDGDTVIVIPTAGQKISASSPLDKLRDFDPQKEYAAYSGMTRVGDGDGFRKQKEMGSVSNLITDMTLKGASEDEIVRAVKHSMVIIDAEKHNLNWKQSAIDNGIAELKTRYQGGPRSGASTLISKASSEKRVNERKEGELREDPETGKKKRYYFDPDTGEKLYTYTNRSIVKKVFNKETGKNEYIDTGKPATMISTHMYETKDARALSSGTKKEEMYANYANKLKALGNLARVELGKVQSTKRSASAAKVYEAEVTSLLAKLKTAIANKPKERQAQLIANRRIDQKIKSSPELKDDKDALKKLRTEALTAARTQVGASKRDSGIKITEREWEAILAGALSSSKITEILNNANSDHIKALATPRKETRKLSSSDISKARTMSKNGYTLKEIASQFGVSTTSIYNALSD